jgi:hypothetical protein
MLPNRFVHALPLAIGIMLIVSSSQAADKGHSIKKCQDATGHWHYGDTAAEECARSKITVITEQGTTKKVISAPPSQQELKAQEALRETEAEGKKQAEEQARRDATLLTTYVVESDIIYVRDRKIAQVESQVKASEETLKSLRAALTRMEAQAVDESKGGKEGADKSTAKNIEQTRTQIMRHEAAIAAKRKEQAELRQQYAKELERYRELKKGQLATSSPPAKKP